LFVYLFAILFVIDVYFQGGWARRAVFGWV